MACSAVIPDNREVGRTKKNSNLKEGTAMGVKLMHTGSNEIGNKIHDRED